MSKTPLRVLCLSALIIIIVMMWISTATIKQADNSLAKLLEEKGSSLIALCESILRSAMRHEIGIRLQVLLEEMTINKDILFACVTMPDGTILAHSNAARLGDVLNMDGASATKAAMDELGADYLTKWRFMNLEEHNVFVVYKLFNPSYTHKPAKLPIPLIFVGMNVSPFEIMRKQNRIYISILTGISLLMILSSFTAVFFAQRARESEHKQRQAEQHIRELEVEVQRKNKLAAVGSLAAGVAHEIRNPLSSIKGFATYFGELFPPGSDNRASAQIMVQEVDRLNRVICDLISLAKPSDLNITAVNPIEILSKVGLLLRYDLEKSKVSLKIGHGQHVPTIYADAERLHQALINLSLNALGAMPNGGRLTLYVRRSTLGIHFYVIDTGVGIAQDIIPHIFDPYFTTRGNGTGLGLAIVAKIIDAHHGKIWVRSRHKSDEISKASGTMFVIFLPIKWGIDAT